MTENKVRGYSILFLQNIIVEWTKLGKAGSKRILLGDTLIFPLHIIAVLSITNLELLLYMIVFFPLIERFSLIVVKRLILILTAIFGGNITKEFFIFFFFDNKFSLNISVKLSFFKFSIFSG